MPNEFMRQVPSASEREQTLFKEIELGSGLNEGDLLKAINRLDAQIKEEEDLQASDDLTTATNQNIHPSVAAKHARLAGLDITSGDQLKAAKPALKRMSKTFTDPNIPADVRAESLQRDREDVEQILLRSTIRDGVRGVEVVKGVPEGSEAITERPTGDRGFLETDPESPRFFPEPERADPQDTEAFMRTLEPETTQLRGIRGIRDINEAKQRNAIRIAEFQAGRAEQFTLGQGQQRFETEGGETTRIAGVAPKPAPATKRPTTIEAALLDPNITPTRQQELVLLKQALRGKGLSGSITLADGTQITLGEKEGPTPPFKTQIQKETFSTVTGLQELASLKEKITPESFGAVSVLKKAMQESFEFFSPGSTPKWVAETTTNRDKLFRQSGESFALWIKKLTGVQFGEREAERLKKGYPNADDNFAEYTNKFEDIVDSYVRSVARLKRFESPSDPNIRKQIFNAVPLSSITQEEIAAVKQSFGMADAPLPPNITEDDIQETIKQNPGETRESILLKIQR